MKANSRGIWSWWYTEGNHSNNKNKPSPWLNWLKSPHINIISSVYIIRYTMSENHKIMKQKSTTKKPTMKKQNNKQI